MINSQDVKNGVCIRMDGRLYFVIDFLHVKPGKGNTIMRVKFKDVEAALQNAAIYYIFELNTHDGVTFTWLNVQEVDYEIQTAIHADANTVLNVL